MSIIDQMLFYLFLFKDHQHEEILQTRRGRVKTKNYKCTFFSSKINSLGYKVSKDEIKLLEKIKKQRKHFQIQTV
jgi:hypothetical protein